MTLKNIQTESDLFKAIDGILDPCDEIISIGYDMEDRYFDVETTSGLFIKGNF